FNWPLPATTRSGTDAAAKLGRQISSVGYFDVFEREPALQLTQLLRQLGRDSARVLPRLDEGALHHQHAPLSIGLQVTPTHQRISQQKRTHVVAIDAPSRRRVHLYGVLHAKESLDALALPHQRIKRSDNRASVNFPWHRNSRSKVRRLRPALDASSNQPP